MGGTPFPEKPVFKKIFPEKNSKFSKRASLFYPIFITVKNYLYIKLILIDE
jgi:hypothetical protein